MKEIEKHIVFEKMKPSKSVVRYVERQIEKWLEQEQSRIHCEASDYFIKMEKEALEPCFHCFIKVHVGPHEFQSYESGKTLQDVVSHGLRHLRATNPILQGGAMSC